MLHLHRNSTAALPVVEEQLESVAAKLDTYQPHGPNGAAPRAELFHQGPRVELRALGAGLLLVGDALQTQLPQAVRLEAADQPQIAQRRRLHGGAEEGIPPAGIRAEPRKCHAVRFAPT